MPYAPEARFRAPSPKVLAATSTGTFEGYASLFNIADDGRDVVLPGAFHETVRRKGTRGIRLLFQHDPAQPIGVWEEIREDARGLYVRGRLAAEASRAAEVLALLRAGAVDGLSIGFRVLRARRDPTRRLRLIDEVDLWEISVVTFPMQPGARIAGLGRGEGGGSDRPPHVAPLHLSSAGRRSAVLADRR